MNTFDEMPLTDIEKEYWRKRWSDCFPATYPPEIWSEKIIEHTEGFWIFKRRYSYTVAVCRLCGERISTGHYCNELKS